MKVAIPYEYTEEAIPPRCRKPRPVRMKDTMTVTIHELRGDETPVAIVQRDPLHVGNRPEEIIYRWWRKRLWTRGYPSGRESHPRLGPAGTWPYPEPYLAKSRVRSSIRRFQQTTALIDGEVWRVADEPRYVLMTFGLGCNHGGTSLMVDNHYNSNIHRERYYRIDQREAAIAETARVALERGDDQSVPVEPHADFDILIPEAVRLCPRKEHGTGDPFINKVEALTTVKNRTLAGLGALALLGQEMKQ